MSYKGKFKPRNPQKYRGNVNNIIYRSLWELKFLRIMDTHPDVVWYSSEELAVPYLNPADNKVHRYFPDVIACYKKEGTEVEDIVMIEIKPLAQSMAPDPKRKRATPTGRVSTRYLREAKTFAKNDAKWNAAKKYCASKGWRFQVITEKGPVPV